MPSTKLTKRKIDALKAGDVAWDSTVRGFGARRRASGVTYMLKYRFLGRQRWYSIGQHGSPWTVGTARKEAVRLLGLVAAGTDPTETKEAGKRDMTVAELCDLYLAEGCTTKKPSSVKIDTGRIEWHIKPRLGRKRISALTRADVERFLIDVAEGKTSADVKTGPHGRAIVKGGKGTANKAVSLLSAIFAFAVSRKIATDNPADRIKKYRGKKHERYLSVEELSRLGVALDEAERQGLNPVALGVIRLAAMTGARRSELLTMRWSYIDFEHGVARLPDSKTGAKVMTLGAPALALLAEVPRLAGNEFVFPGAKPGQHFEGLDKIWNRVRERAGLSDCRFHDLRHGFASFGAARGNSLFIIGRLLGHTNTTMTERYSHLADDPLRVAADEISGQIASALGGQKAAPVVALSSRKNG